MLTTDMKIIKPRNLFLYQTIFEVTFEIGTWSVGVVKDFRSKYINLELQASIDPRYSLGIKNIEDVT